ncbi:unnamed protein product [Ascophyllum nodosum]
MWHTLAKASIAVLSMSVSMSMSMSASKDCVYNDVNANNCQCPCQGQLRCRCQYQCRRRQYQCNEVNVDVLCHSERFKQRDQCPRAEVTRCINSKYEYRRLGYWPLKIRRSRFAHQTWGSQHPVMKYIQRKLYIRIC